MFIQNWKLRQAKKSKGVWFVSWWLRLLEQAKFIVACLLCMANTVFLWQVCPSGRKDSAMDAHHCKKIRTWDKPIEPLRLMWLRGLMVWSGKTDESQRNKFVFSSDEEVQEWVRLWIHQRPTSFYKTGIDRLVSSGINALTLLAIHLISLSKFNLPLIGTFTWPTPPGPYRATTCRGRALNYGSQTYFFDHTRTWRASPDDCFWQLLLNKADSIVAL